MSKFKRFFKYVEAALKLVYLLILFIVLALLFLVYDYSKHILSKILSELFK
jgi:hypothetical protein